MTTLTTINTLARIDDRSQPDRAVYATTIDPIFTVGDAVHGGTLQMLSANAAKQGFVDLAVDGVVDPAVTPLAIESSFLSSPKPAEVTIEVWLRKRGRTVSLADVQVCQGDRVQVHSAITLGVPDTSALYAADLPLAQLPVEPPEDALWLDSTPMRDIMHVGEAVHIVGDRSTAEFLQGRTGDPVLRLWVKPKGAEPDPWFAVLSSDISAPVTVNLGRFGWAPTMSLTTYFRRHPAPGWLRVQASSTVIGDRWFDEDHLVIDSQGAVVAQSRQMAMVPDK